MKGNSQFGLRGSLGTVLGILALAASLAAGPAPANGANAAAPPDGASPVRWVSIPSLPNLPKLVCPGSVTCDGPDQLAREMMKLIDADRLNPTNARETGGNTERLKWDARLAQVALEHSEDMVRRHYFGHVDPNGNSPVERVTKAGVRWRAIGENIAKNFSVTGAEEAFMSEPHFQSNHRANILNPKFNYVGVGIAQGPDGMVYVTQEFAQEQ